MPRELNKTQRMKCNRSICKVFMVGVLTEQTTTNKLQEPVSETDLRVDIMLNLTPENHLGRILREANYILVCYNFLLILGQ